MNTVIWKFPLRPVDLTKSFDVEMPAGAKVLSVGVQGQELMAWALVDPKAPIEARPFFVVGTGIKAPVALTTFIGTIFDGSFVWHVFEFVR